MSLFGSEARAKPKLGILRKNINQQIARIQAKFSERYSNILERAKKDFSVVKSKFMEFLESKGPPLPLAGPLPGVWACLDLPRRGRRAKCGRAPGVWIWRDSGAGLPGPAPLSRRVPCAAGAIAFADWLWLLC